MAKPAVARLSRSDAAQEAEDQLAQSAAGSVLPGQALLAGLARPIAAIILLIALFTTISGKPCSMIVKRYSLK
jgi:hypothetical protein